MEKNYYAHLTLKSENRKTGPIPTSITSRMTCPVGCAFRENGCYAEGGPVALHWAKVTRGEAGMGWEMFCDAVATLPDGQLWRHDVAGDLPGDGVTIDREALDMLVKANSGKRGFTYTHYSPQLHENQRAIAEANLQGFTINLSANSPAEADAYASQFPFAPVVCALPRDQLTNTTTPAGRTITVCPAVTREDVSCSTCKLCSHPQRQVIVGFPAHGSGAKKVELYVRNSQTCLTP